ncbi:hypothetical protein CHS0354_001472 [Potamilus streckersoni]|uniref:WAP domain-containing protein n=1 Tax=Potamilus streckersoni TaxID=2493646 RepID=A0AAE0T836_9BIVA|nr:hypothetical protein CHS0354_001472 [Potamilus streckersoni]
MLFSMVLGFHQLGAHFRAKASKPAPDKQTSRDLRERPLAVGSVHCYRQDLQKTFYNRDWGQYDNQHIEIKLNCCCQIQLTTMGCLYIAFLLFLTNAVCQIITTDVVNKRGSCPQSRGSGICVELCSSDIDCSGNQKCCSNGCGHTCQNPVDVEPQNPCDFGSPLSSIFCGYGPTHQDCPKGYSCKIDPLDAYAVCCSEDLCPEGEDSTKCYVDPCDVITCLAFPDAQCIPNYCNGCYASFFIGGKNVTSVCEGADEPPCPEGSTRVECKVDPCEVTKCPQYPSARCVPNYCGGCYAAFFVGEKNVTEKCRVSNIRDGSCQDGSVIVDCLVDPCKDAKCSQRPRARCVVNYCGGCRAEFFVGKRNVTEKCEVSQHCPDGKPIVSCKVDPCQVTKCPKYPRARCVAHYCGGCHAHFFVGERNVTKDCQTSEPCPDGKPPVSCLDDPCQVTKCPKYPQARCVANYCGGCHAHFFVGERNVTKDCQTSEPCPDGKPPVSCLVDPCQVTKCPKYPQARCVAHYCGGCHAHFFVGERNVTKDCQTSGLCPDGSQPVNCYENPCQFAKCPYSKCVPNYCGGCYAVCV